MKDGKGWVDLPVRVEVFWGRVLDRDSGPPV